MAVDMVVDVKARNVLTFEIEADELEIFLQDVDEHLQAMETGILDLEQNGDADTLNTTFRAAHTIKAVAATVGHTRMSELTHTLETLFDAMREGTLSPAPAVTDELLATVDVLKALRNEVVTRRSSGVDVDTCLARLRALKDDGSGGQNKSSATLLLEKSEPPGDAQSLLTAEQAAQVEGYREEGYDVMEVDVTTRVGTFAPGARLLQAALALAEVGRVITQRPAQTDLIGDPHGGHLWLILATQAGTKTVEETLSHVSDMAGFWVRPCTLEAESRKQEAGGQVSDVPVRQQDQAVQRPGDQTRTRPTDQTVRIGVERLDTLMTLVGELVTDRTRLVQIHDTLRSQYGGNGVQRSNGAIGALSDMVTHFDRVVDRLQEEVLQARMLPIEHIFAKFPRLVRDVARAAGKQVDLVIEGEATELDRSIIEVIGDPLIHLLRNAVDHGIESPQERIAAGKPPTGAVWLTAAHEAGHIVITVTDDGRGIDPGRIRRSAVSRGLMSEEDVVQLDDDAAINLVFLPNLSTAERVTDVSGRGVGLDVVRTNVKQLSGTVEVGNDVGHGTTFRVTLPLTLAIVQAMMVELGDDVHAIPLAGIVETFYLSDVNVSSVKGKPVVQWRDRVLPLVDLGQFFAQTGAWQKNSVSRQTVVVVTWGKLQVGLVVDRLIGKQEIVIKALTSFIGSVPGLSGCTILGDGRIALILDISGLISAYLQAQRQEIVK